MASASTAPGSGPPQAANRHARRRARTRAALVAAARHLFATQGFDATTIGEIAEAADTAHGSFYNHFAGRDELLEAVLADSLAEHLPLLRASRAGVDDPAERVSVAHRYLLAAARADPEWGWLVLRLEVPNRVLESILWDDAMADLQDGIRAGEFAVADPVIALQASGGALIGSMHVILREGLGPEADAAHAEGVLRSFGLAPAAAEEIARRPLPAATGPA